MSNRKKLAVALVVIMVILSSCMALFIASDTDFKRDKDWPDATPGDNNDPR